MKTSTALAFLLLTLLVACLPAMSAWAAPFSMEKKLTASDAAADDQFGSSAAISDNMAIVGAVGGESAYLFDADPLSPTFGDELLKLTASDAAANDRFGESAGISGDTVIVGARFDDNAGSAYLFDADPLSPTFGDELLKLTASDAAADDNFGLSVAISGSMAVVGAFHNDDAGNQSGSAYLFDADPLSPTFGDELLKLTASDAAGNDHFGSYVAISDDMAIVGAYMSKVAGVSSGSAYLFDADPLSPTFGDELLKLTASDAAQNDEFGFSVAISDNMAIVGAWGGESAYLFDADPLSPTFGDELLKLTASDGAGNDRFGEYVGISGGTVIVGARVDDHAGSAYLFDTDPLSPTFGDELLKLTASDAAAGDHFGISVGIAGNTAIVGARGNNDVGNHSGSAYLFTIPEPSSTLLAVLGAMASMGLMLRRRGLTR